MTTALLEKLMSAAVREGHPAAVTLDLTTSCNLACTHCYRVLDRRYMDTGLALAAIDDALSLGAIKIGLNGGEPTIHPDFFTIAEHALASGLFLSLNTNGTTHHRGLLDLASRWRGIRFQVSLYGYDDASSRAITGVPSVFSSTMRFLRSLLDLGFQPHIVLLARRDTADRLPSLISSLRDEGFRHIMMVYRFERREDGDPAPLAFAPTTEQMARLMELELPSFDPADVDVAVTEGMRACGAGSVSIDVGVDGTVRPCVMFPVILGTFRKRGDLVAIWNGEERRRFLESEAIRMPEACVHCPLIRECTYCPASAYRALARYGAPHPLSCLEARMRHDIRQALTFRTKE